VTLDPVVNWWDESWKRRREINITGVGTVIDFPAYLNITMDSFMQADYDDLRFVNSSCSAPGGDLLAHEIENYTSDSAHVWVKIPLINSGDNSICVYYNNSGASATNNITDVWNNSFAMVYHFNEDAGDTTIADSANHTNGTASGGMVFGVDGKVGGTANFASGTGITLGIVGSEILTTNTTISYWIYSNNIASPSRQNPFDQAYGGWGTETLETSGSISWFFGNHGGDGNYYGSHASGALVTNGAWIYVTQTRNSSGLVYSHYKNGEYFAGSTYNLTYPVIASQVFTIGDGYVNPINGLIDEFRVSMVTRSKDWINQSYQMMEAPATYVTFGGSENASTAKGIISTTPGATPFWTNASLNPWNISLDQDESRQIVFWVNATGDIKSNHTFFAYANLTGDLSRGNITANWSVTITPPIPSTIDLDLIYPTGNINVLQNTTFNVTLNVTCRYAKCNEVNVSLDPPAIGGNITTDGDYTVHTFFENGSITFPSSITEVEVLVVAGGGGGGGTIAGGGGGGGLLYNLSHPVTATNYTVVVGSGGLGALGYNSAEQTGRNGTNSSFDTLIARGGGGGAGWSGYPPAVGGSGGGASAGGTTGAAGISGQGNKGGNYVTNYGGGGGGASTEGDWGVGYNNATGGNGTMYNISGTDTYYAGGGGGGVRSTTNQPGSQGGLGGGGAGYNISQKNVSQNGINGTGGGGGGAGYNGGNAGVRIGGQGGSGIVIIRYLTGGKNGLVSTTPGDTPFWTNASTNPWNITLGVNESRLITFWVNATGDKGKNHTFFAFVNKTSDMSIGNITIKWNVSILAPPPSAIDLDLIYPTGNIGATQNKTFNVTLNITCRYAECGIINVSLDPALPATGGNITTNGSYTLHTFTSNGSFNVTGSLENVEVLVVGGGGGGGETIGGGGGAGGVIHNLSYLVSIGSNYTVSIGGGGAGGNGGGYPAGVKGGNSTFDTLLAAGGGAGAGYNVGAVGTGGSAGGTGAGAGARAGYIAAQGNDGANQGDTNSAGGAGGAGTAGAPGSGSVGGDGGNGTQINITGVDTYYAGGGGGGTRNTAGTSAGGLGGGGAGAQDGDAGTSGTNETGGGGGGGG